MDAFQLFFQDGTPTPVWVCGKCNYLHGREMGRDIGQERAEACCRPKLCPDCGAETERYRPVCWPCWQKQEARKAAERLQAAEKLDAWDGWVYWEGAGPSDGFFESLDALQEWWEDEVADSDDARPLPKFVHVCRPEPFRKLELHELVEICTEDSFEGAEAQLSGLKELRQALDAFNAANVGLVSYTPDWSRAVCVQAEGDGDE